MNTITKEELKSYSNEKLVDMLLVYINKENARLQKQSDYHKQYNEKKSIELKEFKSWKLQQK
jgi:hypothetical protein